MALVTISRQLGSLGHEVAVKAAQALKYALVDRRSLSTELDGAVASQLATALMTQGPPEPATSSASSSSDDPPPRLMAAFADAIRATDPRRGIVLVGRGGQCLFHDTPGALHVQIVAPWQLRLERVITARPDLGADQAAVLLKKNDQNRAAFVRYWFNRDWLDPTLYHVVLNTGLMSPDAAALTIARMAKEAARAEAAKATAITAAAGCALVSQPGDHSFAHPSEEEFARLLDFYRIEWRYEPTTFPIEWDDAGNVTHAFTPDFYLPGLDLYVELTTAKQSLVTRKNRKIRRLHELYPDVNLKVFYGRDFEKLFLKYGKNGTLG